MDREAFLRRLADAYHRGILVPFIGAGMSIDAAPDWGGLVRHLDGAPAAGAEHNAGDRDILIRRAEEAVRRLRRHPSGVRKAITEAIYPGNGTKVPTPQSAALAAIRWPLVLSTNYEDCFHRAAAASGYEFRVLGRRDSARVLASLSALDEPTLWALQGFVPPADGASPLPDLSDELVVGHAEYRRVTHSDLAFRRSFAEVFRRRSLLFLGSGISEPYFLNLFEEIAELHGENPNPHFAILPSEEVDTEFLRQRYGIEVLEYPAKDHGQLPLLLKELKEAIGIKPRIGPVEWRYSLARSNGPEVELAIRRAALASADLGPEHAIVVSAGREGDRPYLSSTLDPLLVPAIGRRDKRVSSPKGKTGLVWHHGESPSGCQVLSVSAWGSGRDLALVEQGLRDALDIAEADETRFLHLTLLASGDSAGFPREYSLAAMLRAIRNWQRDRRGSAVSTIVIYVRDPEVGAAIASQRLMPQELLSDEAFPFTVEVRLPDGGSERRLFRGTESDSLEMLAQELRIPASGWVAQAIPRFREPQPVGAAAEVTLGHLGVIPGSTLHFEQAHVGASKPSLPEAHRGSAVRR